MSRRPVIGITCYVEQARWGVWDKPAVVLPYDYVRHVEQAGGRAVVLPPSPDGLVELLEVLDGLVVAGGADIDPVVYGAVAHAETAGLRPDRDTGEAPLVRAAAQQDLPVLGICRGMQLLAVVHGGSLLQHLPEVVGHDEHRPAPGVYGLHEVRLAPGSRAHQVLGERVDVPSYHHQGLDPDAVGALEVTGWAHDGSPEVVEDPRRRFVLGVLWHPEAGEDPRLFDALVAASSG